MYYILSVVISVGREAEHAWNLWGSRMFLSKYASISTVRVQGTFKDQPRQFSRLLDRARLPSNVAYYYHTFMRLKDSNVISKNEKVLEEWKAYEPPSLHAGTLHMSRTSTKPCLTFSLMFYFILICFNLFSFFLF